MTRATRQSRRLPGSVIQQQPQQLQGARKRDRVPVLPAEGALKAPVSSRGAVQYETHGRYPAGPKGTGCRTVAIAEVTMRIIAIPGSVVPRGIPRFPQLAAPRASCRAASCDRDDTPSLT